MLIDKGQLYVLNDDDTESIKSESGHFVENIMNCYLLVNQSNGSGCVDTSSRNRCASQYIKTKRIDTITGADLCLFC
jgi:hypothetical protein